ncbi:MAG: 16S rRNA (cytidine(1402)-2'-O)-methyltransferase [Pseudomonadota bacterium]
MNHQASIVTKSGVLYIVATPIGNLQDMTSRAIATLKSVDLIVCEDTRHSRKLLNFFQINRPLAALHDFNEAYKAKQFIAKLQQGENIAYISDAGTPLISDPGYRLVCLAHENQIKVIPIPGACALITALSAAGLPCDQFRFCGFLPAKAKAKQEQLTALADANATLIFYEAPHRLLTTLQTLQEIFGVDRLAAVGKELTKLNEMIFRGSLAEIYSELAKEKILGEWVILIAPMQKTEKTVPDEVKISIDNLLTILLKQLPLKQAVQIASKISNQAKNKLYQRALDLNE